MSLEAVNYGDFSASLSSRSTLQRIPLLASVEVSHRCPLNCSHCYNNLPMADLATAKSELTLAEYRRIFGEMAELGSMWVLLTGGEIFARRDFLAIYTEAKRAGFIVTLFTNGTLITPKIADYLMEWRPFAIEITLYGRTKETYERLTRIPGSYERCIRGIQLLKERNLPLTLKTVAVSVNRHEVWDMKSFAEEELGLPFKLDAMINPRTDCSSSPLAVRLTPREVVEMDFGDKDRKDEWKKFSENFNGPVHPRGMEDEVYHCGGGVNSFAIDPLGKMTICVLSQREGYDLRQGTVKEGWEHFLRAVRTRKTSRVTKCSTCQIKASCGMCPANGELESGDPESPVDFLCHTAHLRAYTLNWQIPAHGTCEYCPGGENFSAVQEEAQQLRAGTNRPNFAKPISLPVLGGAATELPSLLPVGCGGCGGH